MSTALGEVCFGDEDRYPLEATVDRYFSPDYQQRTDGELVDRESFVEHIRALRALVAEGQIEVYLFGEFADDGRLCRVDEVSRVVAGREEDVARARAR